MQRPAGFLPIVFAALALLASGTTFSHQTFPSRPIRIVVPFPPGGLNDIVARTLAPPLSKALGQPVLVENRPGGSSAIAAENVARSPADGHTLLIMGFSFFANAALRSTGEMLKLAARIDMVHVPYQGDGPAVVAVLGGQTGVMISTITGVAAQVAAGKLRPIAVTSLGRFEPMKDVPMFAESGMPGFEMTSNLGFVMHAGTPREIVNRLGAEIVRAQELPEVKEPLAKQATKIASLGPADYDALMRAEIVKIQRVVRETKIKLD